MERFEKLLGNKNPILRVARNRGFESPTEIQEKTIPVILEGKDVIAGAATGSGKTLAFAAGLIKNVNKLGKIQGLVLTPTRELAEQITNEIEEFSRDKKLEVISVYGGVSMSSQIRKIPYADIVVGTPGRIKDHLERNSIDFSHVNTLVLDEADRMLDMGFIEDVSAIVSQCPLKRQTLLFSATITDEVVGISNKYMKHAVEISATEYVDPKKLEQIYYDIEQNLKFSLLKHLLEKERAGLVMVFCNTRKNVDFVAKNLMFSGINAVAVHGGFTQEKRNKMMSHFHSNRVDILIATDVAARGLDIKGVSHVYNYDIPLNRTEYVHRIGRTARGGKEGKVINLVAPRDYDKFRAVNPKDFGILNVEAPRVPRVRIRWMPENKHERSRRRSNGNQRSSRGRPNSNSQNKFRKIRR